MSLVGDGLVRHGTWRCFNVVGGLLSWIASRRGALADLDECSVEWYLRHRAGKQSIQPGDRSALKWWLSVLRAEGLIAPAVLPPVTSHDRIFNEFDAYLRTERGLAPKSIVRHLPVVRRFLHKVCPAGDDDLGKISLEEVIRYIERHAQDWSPGTGKAMCWSLRAFLRCLHYQGLNPRGLADCVPSIRRWKLASLPTFLSAAQVQRTLDGCDRATPMGRRDYAILMMLAKLGLWAGKVATLTPDDIDWRASEMLVRAKGRQRARMDAGDYLRALARRIGVVDDEVRIMRSKGGVIRMLAAGSGVRSATLGVRSSILS
ncbi:site-specific integrase [Acidisphaera sp. S103]|uniref:tyrosine-type recombinase/integrase n=1 Tax=Acidisphaera sp. S103 TaxID=1747223 RepID=UPI00131A68C3|nr:site-specific integrase [Acidisphaera sp. S103]